MSEMRAKGCLLAAVIWCVILAVLGVAYKFLLHPYFADKLKGATGSASQYKKEIIVAADSFSGYCILRSDAVKEDLFYRHRDRFKENIPDSIYDFLSEEPAVNPCRNQEICVYDGDRLLATSFLDIGASLSRSPEGTARTDA